MERLTKRIDGIAVLESWAIDKDKVSIIQRLCNRLSAYEDLMERWKLRSIEEADRIFQRVNALGGTDLMAQYRAIGFIDHLRDLLQAEQDGRLVVLPCKVGDSVYIPDLDKKIPVKVRVQGISISVSGRTILHFGGYPVECAWGDGCGKDWFLTREEAEAALAPKGGEG